ncbi:hypothetical protein [Staphylococcus epidermidis]|uniref:hypothetical protein n=1 Tax=Staphylococcus epidermidis TaxID=1282 RepID=UPI00352D2FB5
MIVLFLGLIFLFIAYIASHLVFLTQITTKRKISFFAMSILSLYVTLGSLVYTFSMIGG